MFSRVDQCCQVVEISAKKLKRGRGKKSAGKISGRILAEFFQKWQKRGQRIFSTKVPYLTVRTHFQRQRKTWTLLRIDPSCCTLQCRFCEICLFPELSELFWCSSRKTISGPGNTGVGVENRSLWKNVVLCNLEPEFLLNSCVEKTYGLDKTCANL